MITWQTLQIKILRSLFEKGHKIFYKCATELQIIPQTDILNKHELNSDFTVFRGFMPFKSHFGFNPNFLY